VADVVIAIRSELFLAEFEDATAPATCARFRALLPYEDQLIHARWSGEACWIPLGGRDLGIGYENATSYPAPSGRRSETEILLAYGPTRFASKARLASKAGQLAGNHFLTIREDLDRLAQICRTVLWQGATPITLRAA